MSNYETKPGSGAIFKNNRKEKETHPDYNGKIVDPSGKEWEISLWVKKAEGKTPFFSAAIKEPYKKPEVAQSPQQMLDDDSDDLPF